ncbi:MAG: hypothetical protein K0Q47_7 [Sedimentibacter sp.]|jgi:hypothetical protein|nr:hypothetical protein [Sedimentibacter sp.]
MSPIMMNTMDIEVRVLINDSNKDAFPSYQHTEYDDIFRQPTTPGGKKYTDPILLEDIAQFRNKKMKKWNFKDSDNLTLESEAHLTFSKEDWDDATSQLGCELKKGDLVVSVADNPVDLIINEIRPTGFLNGENTLIMLTLSDNTKSMGGVI